MTARISRHGSADGTRTVLVVVCATFLVGPGCYASHERVSADDWALAIARAVCETNDECPNALGFARGGTPGIHGRGDLDVCMRFGAGAATVRQLAPWVAAIEAGDAELDAAAIAGCVAAIHDATCGARITFSGGREGFASAPPFHVGYPGRPGFDARCDVQFVPLRPPLADGTRCDGPFDCADGSFCGELGGSERVCHSLIALGTACAEHWECFGSGQLCIEGRCTETTRRRIARVDEPCGLLGAIDERCAPGLECAGPFFGDTPPRFCRPTLAEGEACDGLVGCAGPLVCARPVPGEAGTCTRIERATEAGAVCAGFPDRTVTTTCDPRAGLRCSSVDETPGVCVAE